MAESCLTPFETPESHGGTFVKPQGGTPFYFEDFTCNAITTRMRIGGGDRVNAVMSRPLRDFKLAVFGAENDDVLTGQRRGDLTCGDVGDDTLSDCNAWRAAT